MKNSLILGIGVAVGVGLTVLAFRFGGPAVRDFLTSSGGADREPAVEVSSGQPRQGSGRVESVQIGDRVIRTREPPADEQTTDGSKGAGERAGTFRGEEIRRRYEEKNEKYRRQLPIDPGVAEEILKALESGAENFGGSTASLSVPKDLEGREETSGGR